MLDNFRLVSMKLDGTDVRRMVSDTFIYDFLIHENGNVTITPTDFNLRNSFEEVFPALFGVEFRERYHKTDKGYYCDMLGIEYYE